MQFKTGNFSYFQTNYGFQQSGRIVNALYGPLIAYILGGILF
ncbi:putative cell division domain protein, partial [Clostridioides difficile CD9]